MERNLISSILLSFLLAVCIFITARIGSTDMKLGKDETYLYTRVSTCLSYRLNIFGIITSAALEKNGVICLSQHIKAKK